MRVSLVREPGTAPRFHQDACSPAIVAELRLDIRPPLRICGQRAKFIPHAQALDELVALLDLETIEVNVFRGQSPQDGGQRVFGGQVMGQAMVAAGRTAPDEGEVMHSFHAYLLRPGDPSIPILYTVDRTKDGR
jgi:hypothetical protein